MLEIRDISKSFGSLTVFQDLSLELQDGEILALTGPSGCGKSSLLNLIAGLEQPDSGIIRGTDARISYMFQNARLLPWRTVYENIRLVNEAAGDEQIHSLINAVGLSGFENYYPSQLSGGMAKRCALARAFHHGGQLLLMDEPFQGLDYGLRMEMLSMVIDIWHAHRPSILFVTHEIDEALTLASRIAVLSPRPARLRAILELPGPEGRDCASPSLAPLRAELLQMIVNTGENPDL